MEKIKFWIIYSKLFPGYLRNSMTVFKWCVFFNPTSNQVSTTVQKFNIGRYGGAFSVLFLSPFFYMARYGLFWLAACCSSAVIWIGYERIHCFSFVYFSASDSSSLTSLQCCLLVYMPVWLSLVVEEKKHQKHF